MLILGVAIVALPIWITFVAATHDAVRMTQAPIPMLPGGYFWENFKQTLFGGPAFRGPRSRRSGGCC